MKIILQLLILVRIFTWVIPSFAENAPVYALDTMTVTATPGLSKKIQDVQASVEVIGQERLQALSIQSVPQLLQYATGVAIVYSGVAERGQRETHLFRESVNSPELDLGFVNSTHRLSFETRHRDPFQFDKNSPVTNLTGSEKYFVNYNGNFDFTPGRSLNFNAEYL